MREFFQILSDKNAQCFICSRNFQKLDFTKLAKFSKLIISNLEISRNLVSLFSSFLKTFLNKIKHYVCSFFKMKFLHKSKHLVPSLMRFP